MIESKELTDWTKQQILDKISADVKNLFTNMIGKEIGTSSIETITKNAKEHLKEQLFHWAGNGQVDYSLIQMDVLPGGEYNFVLIPLNLITAALMHGFSINPAEVIKTPEAEYWGYPMGTLYQDHKTKKIHFIPTEIKINIPNEKESNH